MCANEYQTRVILMNQADGKLAYLQSPLIDHNVRSQLISKTIMHIYALIAVVAPPHSLIFNKTAIINRRQERY